MEMDAVTKMPKGWTFGFNDDQKTAYNVKLDTAVKYSGMHAVSFESLSKQSHFYAIDYPIFKTFEGGEILVKGHIKTENVKSGYAGLWMRIDGEQGAIAFDNMESRGVKGNSEWKEYSIRLAYDATAAKSIHIGGLLVGDGKAWFDNLELSIDGKSIESAPEKKPDTRKASLDTMAFQSAPNVTVIGSTTSGADGNVSQIRLPGGVNTMISGLGIFYPDGKPTQRVGVKIDHVIKPTIKGVREVRDELLEKAKQIIEHSN